MKAVAVILVVCGLAALGSSEPAQSSDLVVHEVGCLCQCSGLTYKENNILEGNCLTEYDDKKWCFVDEELNQCSDLGDPWRFTGPKGAWSYQACYSPSKHHWDCKRQIEEFRANQAEAATAGPTIVVNAVANANVNVAPAA